MDGKPVVQPPPALVTTSGNHGDQPQHPAQITGVAMRRDIKPVELLLMRMDGKPVELLACYLRLRHLQDQQTPVLCDYLQAEASA
jgi:hypothetical protein